MERSGSMQSRGLMAGLNPPSGFSEIAYVDHEVNAFSIDALYSQDIISCCSSESLIYVHWP